MNVLHVAMNALFYCYAWPLQTTEAPVPLQQTKSYWNIIQLIVAFQTTRHVLLDPQDPNHSSLSRVASLLAMDSYYDRALIMTAKPPYMGVRWSDLVGSTLPIRKLKTLKQINFS